MMYVICSRAWVDGDKLILAITDSEDKAIKLIQEVKKIDNATKYFYEVVPVL